jgi:hypothetical protein
MTDQVEYYMPTYVSSGNHHTIDWWWACIFQGLFFEAIQQSMKDPGPSGRIQLFVYWPQDTGIPPERFNSYQFDFNLLRDTPGFSDANKNRERYGPSLKAFRHWLWLMTK